jgi:hypothetical protein
MSIKSRIAIVAALILGAASSDLATRAFAANNYDSPDWAPAYSGAAVGREPGASLQKENADRFVQGPRSQPSHKTDRSR